MPYELKVWSISRRQASQLPRRRDIPAAWALKKPAPFFIITRARRKMLMAVYSILGSNTTF
jgi:hypothetical protein